MTHDITPPFNPDDGIDPSVADHAETHVRKLVEGDPRFAELLESVAVLARLIRAYLRGDFKMAWSEAGIIVAALAYLVVPLDALPEAFLGPAGLPDDIAVIAAAISALGAVITRFKKQNLTPPAV